MQYRYVLSDSYPRRKVGEVAGYVQGPAFGFVLKPAASLSFTGFLKTPRPFWIWNNQKQKGNIMKQNGLIAATLGFAAIFTTADAGARVNAQGDCPRNYIKLAGEISSGHCYLKCPDGYVMDKTNTGCVQCPEGSFVLNNYTTCSLKSDDGKKTEIRYYYPSAEPAPDTKIIAKQSNGKNISLNVSLSYSVEKVKSMIQEITGIAQEKIRLSFNGKQMENGKTLQDYSVTKDKIIHIVELR